jgi:hypothetical protein
MAVFDSIIDRFLLPGSGFRCLQFQPPTLVFLRIGTQTNNHTHERGKGG